MCRVERKAMVRRDVPCLSLSGQCEILSISRSSLYCAPKGESPENLALMRRIDALFLRHPLLRQPSDGSPVASRGHLRRPSPGASPDASDGPGSDLSGANDQPALSPPPGIPLPAQGAEHRPARPRLVRGHHLYRGPARLPLSGGNDGLGEPTRPGLATFKHHGRRVLCRGPGGCDEPLRQAGDLQHRPG